MDQPDDLAATFIEAACTPLDDSHVSGTLDRAERILAAHPEIARNSIHTAAVLADEAGVRSFLDIDPQSATRSGGPRGWDPLTYLCFSRYLRIDTSRSAAFVQTARALLENGASAGAGWWEQSDFREPVWEGVLYGAAGIAHHPQLTRLLLQYGADPNDNETVYHTPETYDNRALEALVETGRITRDNLTIMLIRKLDYHDLDGARYVLEHGADPDLVRSTGWMPFHHALKRDCSIEFIELLMDHHTDPLARQHGRTGISTAARAGRGDVLRLLAERGFNADLSGPDRLIAACALADGKQISAVAASDPATLSLVLRDAPDLLAEFAGIGNVEGLRHLLDLGADPATPFHAGDGYYGIPPESLPIHIAAWRGRPDTVRLLIERGSPVDTPDASGATPLALAVRACVDSYWTQRRSPESARALLEAGASRQGISIPTGYDELDEVLSRFPES